MDNNLPRPLDRTFRIGAWIAKPDSNELQAHDSAEIRSLEPRLMQLLCVLAAAPQRVLTRDELMAYLWPKVVVNDNSLTRAVSELRKMLSSDAGITYIETIPKSGYRLAASCPVTLIETADKVTPAATVEMEVGAPAPWMNYPSRQHTLMSRFLPAGVATSMMLGVLTIALQMLPQAVHTDLALADVNLSSQAAVDALIDGKFVATKATEKDLLNIGQDSTPPVISRDGELFAFIHYNDQGSSLMLGSTRLPNSPVTVFTTPDTLYNLQWSPLDKELLFAQAPKFAPAALLPRDKTASLVLFDLETFTTRVLDGPRQKADDGQHDDSPGVFKLTSLSRSLDWLS